MDVITREPIDVVEKVDTTVTHKDVVKTDIVQVIEEIEIVVPVIDE